MDTPQAPTPPDPVATATAQGDMNQNTATTQQLLNMTNQVTPDGTLSYNQSGSNSFTGADGKTYTVPQFTATQTLSPAQQQLLDLTNQTKQNLGQIGVDQSAKIGSLLGTNLDLNTAAENNLDQLAAARLDPQWAKNADALQTSLANQGIQPGSQAWDAQMTQFGQNKNDAYNQMYLTGRGEGVQEALTQRNEPINEISALMSGSQVSSPSFASTPQTNVAGVDYTGMVNNNYNAQTQQYATNMSNANAAAGGMFGLAGTIAGAGIKAAGPALIFSDRRLKRDVVRIGTLQNGLPLYEYTIFGRRERGVMADEVRAVMPDAVAVHPSGFDMVDYAMVGAR